MRNSAAFLFLVAMAGGDAAASSLVFVEPPESGRGASIVLADDARAPSKTPSIVGFGDQAPGTAGSVAEIPQAVVTPSVIALGSPAVTFETVAAIPGNDRPPSALPPMVIRGGLFGDIPEHPRASTAAPPPAAAERSRADARAAPEPPVIDSPGPAER